MELASKDSCTDCGNCRLEQISKLNNISAVGKKCCGCTACVNVCPQKVIYMVENSEGFYYPKIVDKGCIECGLLCQLVQPFGLCDYPRQVLFIHFRRDRSIQNGLKVPLDRGQGRAEIVGHVSDKRLLVLFHLVQFV